VHIQYIGIHRIYQRDRAGREEVLGEGGRREGSNGGRNRVRKEGKKGGGREKRQRKD
jgi:hypothetical protein